MLLLKLLLNHNDFIDVNDADFALQNWRIKYNNIRPHEALNMKCPAEVYTPSDRTYTDKVKKYEYQKTCPDDVDEYVLVNLVYAPNRYYIKYSTNDFKTAH